jgi:hypothetical protein
MSFATCPMQLKNVLRTSLSLHCHEVLIFPNLQIIPFVNILNKLF